MKKLLLLAVTLVTVFIALAITKDYAYDELIENTIILWGLSWFVIFTVLVYWLSNRLEIHKADSLHNLNIARSQAKEIDQIEDNVKELEIDLGKEIEANRNHTKMFERMKKQDLAKIKLGDKVKNVKTNTTSKVYAIRLVNEIAECQLSKGGKWHKRDEIRKIEEVK